MAELVTFMREIIGGPTEAEVSSAVLANFLQVANQDLNTAVNNYFGASLSEPMPLAELPTNTNCTQIGKLHTRVHE